MRALGWGTIGPAAFGTAAAVAGRRTPGYSARDQPISSLAAHGSPAAAVMVPGFLGLAAGTLGLARALRGTVAAPAPVPTLLTVAGLTTAAAGLARCSDPGCPTRGLGNGTPRPGDDLHALASGATFALWIATPLVAAARATGADDAYRRRCRALGGTTAAVLVGGGLLARRPSSRWSGRAQRVMVAVALAWQPLAAATAHAAAAASRGQPGRPMSATQ